MKKLLVTTLLAAFVSVSALAADLGGMKDTMGKAQAAEESKQGVTLYMGLGGGFAATNTDIEGFEGFGSDGIVGELSLGADWILTNQGLLIGIRGDLGLSSNETVLGGMTVNSDYHWRVIGRLGLPIFDSLLYGLVGYQSISLDSNIAGLSLPDADGWVFGAGLEHAINSRMNIAVEGMYVLGEDWTVGGSDPLNTDSVQAMMRINIPLNPRR